MAEALNITGPFNAQVRVRVQRVFTVCVCVFRVCVRVCHVVWCHPPTSGETRRADRKVVVVVVVVRDTHDRAVSCRAPAQDG